MPVEICQYDINGISPLLQHNIAAMDTEPEAPGITVKRTYNKEEEAEKGAYRLPTGDIYHPTLAFRAALYEGAKGRKLGKSFATNIVKGAVFAATIESPLFDPADRKPLRSYEIDVRAVVIGKARVPHARPRYDKWGAEVAFEIDTDFIAAAQVEELLNIAGRVCGVGDFRPEKKGPFGRFTAHLV